MGALGLVAGVTLAPPGPAAEGNMVQMVDNEPDLTNWHFDPAQLQVPAGSTVIWRNQGHEDHSVTADDKSFDSGLKKSGTTFQRVFPRPGKYAYHCAPHPWMTGVIQVVAATPATTVTTVPAAATAPAGAAPTTLPPSPANPAPGQPGTSPAAAQPGASTTTGAPGARTAAPAGKPGHSRRNVPATVALVLIPTLAALGVGAKVRRSRS